MNNKKQIFDEYFANQIHESDLIIRLDSLQTKSVKGDGVIYTPWHIVKKMVHIAEPTLEMNIIEPCTTTYPNLFIDENTTYCTVPVR